MTISARKQRVILKNEWCKGCGICVAFCPKSVLILKDDRVVVMNEEKCIACGMCEMRCPDYAIYLREETAHG